MTDNENQIADLQRQIEGAQYGLSLGKALLNLKNNPDFKLLISEGYLKAEAVRLVHLRCDPNMDQPHQQAAILRDIDAIGSLSEYFRIIARSAEQAERSIKGAEEEIQAIEEEIAQEAN